MHDLTTLPNQYSFNKYTVDTLQLSKVNYQAHIQTSPASIATVLGYKDQQVTE